LEARRRGAIIRPLGDTVVLMPPLSISKGDLRRLLEITGESIQAALAPPVRALRSAGVEQVPQAA
jgi:adenosylmethionine-8-amino-7-oxononanoate aminotransferase